MRAGDRRGTARPEAIVAGRGDAGGNAGGTKGGMMSLQDELRLNAELRAASVLLSALMRQTDAQDFRRVFEDSVVRETAHMLERGARNEAIRAFEDAAGEWSIHSRALRHNGAAQVGRGNGSGNGRSRRQPRY